MCLFFLLVGFLETEHHPTHHPSPKVAAAWHGQGRRQGRGQERRRRWRRGAVRWALRCDGERDVKIIGTGFVERDTWAASPSLLGKPKE